MGTDITIGQGGYEGQNNAVLQRAVDDVAAAGGGTVQIPAGIYNMNDALHLRSGVNIRGEAGTVLRKVPSVASHITDYLGYGFYEFTVEEPEKLDIGMGVQIYDDNAVGFYTTVATIIGRSGDTFHTNRMFHHDYTPSANGEVASLFSLIEGFQVEDATVTHLTLDGNPEETRVLTGCRGAGIFLLQTHRIRLENVEITNYNGDAISFQQSTDIAVRGCHLHHNTGGGLHPGSGTVRYVMEDNHSHDNGGCGIFYCLRTTHSLCRNNHLHDNAMAGISLGERDTDHIISGNTILDNGGAGIEFREPVTRAGDRVRVEGNYIGPNCLANGQHEIAIASGLHDISVTGNTITTHNTKAIAVGDGCTGIAFANNKINGETQTSNDIDGQADGASSAFPAIGPEAANTAHVAHLNLPTLIPLTNQLDR